MFKTQSNHHINRINIVRTLLMNLIHNKPMDPAISAGWINDHVDLLERNLLLPWLYSTIPTNVKQALPENIKLKMTESYEHSALISIIQEASLTRILKILTAHSVPVIGLKGIYLWHSVYHDPALRPISDIDLLIRDEDFDGARSMLSELGFEQAIELPLPKALKVHLQPAVAHCLTGPIPIIVDVHRGLLHLNYYHLKSEEFWNHTEDTVINGQHILMLSLEMNFILCALNSLNHGSLLRDWIDLILIYRRLEFDWGRLLAFARSVGVLRPLYFVLHHLRTHWEIDIPQKIFEDFERYEPHWLEDRVIGSPYRYIWQIVARFQSFPGWRLKLQYLRLAMLPSRDYRVSATGAGGWAHYIKSKSQLLQRLGRHDL